MPNGREPMPPPGPPPAAAAPPPEMGPPPGAGTPEGVMEADAQEAMARQETIAASAPQPEEPFSVTAIQTLIKQFNDTVEDLGGAELPDVEWTPDTPGKKWDAPLPPQIFVPIVALRQALDVIGGGAFGEKYDFRPTEITDDTVLRQVTGQISKMGKDKKLVKAMQAPLEGPPEEAPPERGTAPVPSQMTEEDRMLAENMG